MHTSEEIGASIREVSAALAGLEAGRDGTEEFLALEARFQQLRRQYRDDPQKFAGRIQQLQDLSRRFGGVLERRASVVVDQFHAVTEKIRALEEAKAFWREMLIRIAGVAPPGDLRGTGVAAKVRSLQALDVPRSGSPERKQLEELIQRSGCWNQVSFLSRPRLEEALRRKAFTEPEERTISQLCPATTIHQVTCRKTTA